MNSALKLPSRPPDFSNAQVIKRTTAVLDWCEQFLITKRAIRVSTAELGKIFANRYRGLGRYLYSNLLRQEGTYCVGVHSYSYTLKPEGYEKICRLIGRKVSCELDVAKRKFAAVLDGGVLEYHDNGQRRFHAVQNLRREVRKQVFDGWWDYDIEACAATLVYQFAAAYHRWVYPYQETEPFPAVRRLIDDKLAVREHVAALAKCDMTRAKELLSMLFFRANPAPFETNALFVKLDRDPVRHALLIHDDFIKALRADVKKMWGYAARRDNHERATLAFSGVKGTRSSQKAGKRRMAIYLSLERRVMDVIWDRLNANGEPHVLMHDGFMSQVKVDAVALVEAVKQKTGYEIRLSETQLGAASIESVELDVEELMEEVAVEEQDQEDSELQKAA